MECTLQVVEMKPDWPKGYSRLGAAAIGLGETEKAKAAYEKGARPQRTAASASCMAPQSLGLSQRSGCTSWEERMGLC